MSMTKQTLAALAATCVLCGCMTDTAFQHRVSARADAFDALSADQQERVQLGLIQHGDTRDMLWMALGDPASLNESAAPADADDDANTAAETWVYVWDVQPALPLPSVDTYMPGAMFVSNPPPPPTRVTKTYVFNNGIITDIQTEYDPPRK